jgi:hypothetical protein
MNINGPAFLSVLIVLLPTFMHVYVTATINSGFLSFIYTNGPFFWNGKFFPEIMHHGRNIRAGATRTEINAKAE